MIKSRSATLGFEGKTQWSFKSVQEISIISLLQLDFGSKSTLFPFSCGIVKTGLSLPSSSTLARCTDQISWKSWEPVQILPEASQMRRYNGEFIRKLPRGRSGEVAIPGIARIRQFSAGNGRNVQPGCRALFNWLCVITGNGWKGSSGCQKGTPLD